MFKQSSIGITKMMTPRFNWWITQRVKSEDSLEIVVSKIATFNRDNKEVILQIGSHSCNKEVANSNSR